jgi:hypothetical protein
MLLATLVLLFPLPHSGGDLPKDVAKAVASLPTVGASQPESSSTPNVGTTMNSSLSITLPSAPEPKVKTDAAAASDGQAAPKVAADVNPSAGIEPGPALPIQPVKPAFTRPRETPRQRAAWYALAFTGHGAAAFDAWSSRRAISGGYGTEANPLLRPFSHSSALYAATQASPVLMDYIGKRMMVSPNPWLRRLWWLPQAAGSGVSVFAGVHNMGVVP